MRLWGAPLVSTRNVETQSLFVIKFLFIRLLESSVDDYSPLLVFPLL
jgi:hypothetical protein